MKKLASVLLAVLLIAAMSCSAYADTGIGVEPGQKMPDFTVSLTDGTSATLSELLKENDLVVLNIFASWCEPCKREFPDMEEVYRENSDRMVIVSLSGEPEDTMEIIAEYKTVHGLSFPMGLKGDSLDFIKIPGFPTTIFIDRSGTVGMIKVGAFLDREEFETAVVYFLSPTYNGMPIGFKKAFNFGPFVYGWLLVGGLLLLVGRWGILRKAGKKGWHSLIPLLNVCREYSTVWKGWIGAVYGLCIPLGLLCNILKLPAEIYYALLAANFLLGIPESLRLAKAFGKSKPVGVLMSLPVGREIGRFLLGVGKGRFLPGEDAPAA